MVQITIKIEKDAVYNEVAKTTSYTGSKKIGDEGAYERIFTTDEDQEMLARFWNETVSGAIEQFKSFIGEWSNSDSFTVQLTLSNRFDTNLKDSIQSSLFSHFVAMIISKWFRMANKEEAEEYGIEAAGAMDDVMKKIYYRKKPVRTVIQH